MIKLLFSVVIAVFVFTACSSAGQVQSPESDSNMTSDTPSEDVVAPWYDHNNKAFSDSTEFVGMGMAIAADSAEALESSMSQAQEFLEFAIDSFAEDLRKKVVEDSGSSELGSGSFVLSLRRAVNSMQFSDNDLSTMVEYTTNENDAVIAYTRVSVQRGLAIDKLASTIANSTFSSSLRDSAEE